MEPGSAFLAHFFCNQFVSRTVSPKILVGLDAYSALGSVRYFGLAMASPSDPSTDEESILEAFKKFDSDGSGSISREELGQVLKALDPEAWDKDSIDQALADADASGDGQLQIKEFLRCSFLQRHKWI